VSTVDVRQAYLNRLLSVDISYNYFSLTVAFTYFTHYDNAWCTNWHSDTPNPSNEKKNKTQYDTGTDSFPSKNIPVARQQDAASTCSVGTRCLAFSPLCRLLTEDARCDKEIKKRTAMAKATFMRRGELLRGNISRVLKKLMVKALVCSVALYGSETWTLRKEDIKRIQAFEM